MKPILEFDLSEFLNNPNDLLEGKELFRNCKFNNPDIKIDNSTISLYCNVDNNETTLKVMENQLLEYSCSCDVYKFNQKICKHIICCIDIYNECSKHHVNNYKEMSDVIFVVKPIILFNEKNERIVRITTSFGTNNYQKINIANITNLFKNENEYLFFANFGIKKDQIDSDSQKLLDEFKNILIKTNNLNATSHIDINSESLDEWMYFFASNRISINLNNEDMWLVTDFYFDSIKHDWDIPNSVKPSVNNKKKYSLKGLRDFEFFHFTSNNNIYLFMLNSSKSTLNIYHYPITLERHVINFIEFVNKPVSKNNFYKLYLAIREMFWNYEKVITSIYVVQQNLARIDPVLEIKIFLHDVLNVLTAKFSFIYGENIYPYVENETNYLKRERFLEKKLLDEALQFFNYYNKEHDVFEMIDHQKLIDFQNWAIKKNNDEFFSIKAAEGIVFKPKKRKRFMVQGVKFDNDFLKVDWTLEEFSEDDMKKILQAYVKKIKYVKLSNNREINIEADIDIEQLKEELKSLNTTIEELVEKEHTQVSICNANYFAALYGNKVNDEIKEKIDKIFDDSDIKNELPDNLKNLLKDYQLKGYKWLKKLISLNAGGILADEMGLGKTMQSISILADTYYNKKTNLPSLIICPSSLVYNWSEELKKFAPFIKFVIIDGNQNERYKLLDEIEKYDVIITSLNLLSRDLDKYLEHTFYIKLVDEAQKIKSQSALISKNVKSIKAINKFALTGTPIENNLSELWSIFDYLMPNYLHDYKTFKQLYEDKIVGKDEVALQNLKIKINPFILRRTKKEVLKELPEKSTKILTCEFDDEQKTLYYTELHRGKFEIKNNLENKKEGNNNAQIFQVLSRLRQICCSPKLLYENSISNGSKFKMCMDLVEDAIANGSKILLFSQFVKMIDIISEEFKKRKIIHLSLTGDLGKKERLELVEKFNTKSHIKVFLISLKAGGVGLTLTSADTVIHYDPWWNSSLENQATDRAHRIGQKNNVNIFKLISKDSIEEKVLKLQETKTEMFNQIFDENNLGSKQPSSQISMEQILEVLDIEK